MTDSTGVKVEPQRLRKTNWREYAVRFAFGGAITAVAGLLAHLYGPVLGGLFLAFPAILPASVTLIERHSGKDEAHADIAGAAAGGVGLLAFGAVVWVLASRLPPWTVLLVALAAWFLLSLVVWALFARHASDK
jgi:hypothetical protein